MMEALISLAAALITAFQLVPQALETLKDKDLTHLSRGSFVMISISTFLWILHGSNQRDVAVIFANLVMFSCSVVILVMITKKKAQKGHGRSVRAVKVRRRR